MSPGLTAVPRGYNSSNGETRPACGDVDGDGTDEVVVGFGSGFASGGWIRIIRVTPTGFVPLAYRQLPFSPYNSANGETRPALGDVDGDGRDDCNSGAFDPLNDGLDFDGDGICDVGDSDDDDDGVPDLEDADPNNPLVCRDADNDGCSSGVDDPNNDGLDSDGDGLCDAGDPDDDNDGLPDVDEATFGTDPFNPDTDGDGLLDGTEVESATGSGCPSPTLDDLHADERPGPACRTAVPVGQSSGDRRSVFVPRARHRI